MRDIEDGIAIGHRHAFAEHATGKIFCITVPPLPIFYDVETRLVLRIVDGRRDLSRLIAEP